MAAADDVGAVADAQRLAHVVVGDEHADVALGQVFHDALDIDNRNGVDARERFVQQHETRFHRQRAGDLHAPALAARQTQTFLVAQVGDMQLVQQLFELVAAAAPVEVLAHFQHGHQIVGHAQFAEHRGFLRQVADTSLRAHMHGVTRELVVVEPDRAAVAGDQADNHIETGCLAGAVRAQQADHLAAFERQRDGFHNGFSGVAFFQIRRFLLFLLRPWLKGDMDPLVGLVGAGIDLVSGHVVLDALAFQEVALLLDLRVPEQDDVLGVGVVLHPQGLRTYVLLLVVGQLRIRCRVAFHDDLFHLVALVVHGHGLAGKHQRPLGDLDVAAVNADPLAVVEFDAIGLDRHGLLSVGRQRPRGRRKQARNEPYRCRRDSSHAYPVRSPAAEAAVRPARREDLRR